MGIFMSGIQASNHFGIDRHIIYDLMKRPDFPCVQVGKVKKINSVLAQEWFNEMTRKGEVIR